MGWKIMLGKKGLIPTGRISPLLAEVSPPSWYIWLQDAGGDIGLKQTIYKFEHNSTPPPHFTVGEALRSLYFSSHTNHADQDTEDIYTCNSSRCLLPPTWRHSLEKSMECIDK